MCMKFAKRWQCGAQEAEFMFRDNLIPTEVIKSLHCPACSKDAQFDPASMVRDNGWMLGYDMEVAQFAAFKNSALARKPITTEVLFDDGYATWQGVYPGDLADSIVERQELVKMAKTNPREYMTRMRDWAISRMERLRQEGWRKAQEPVTQGAN